MAKNGKPAQKCLIPGCKGERGYARGLCFVCYHAARHAILDKKTTWEKLEALGLSLPTHRKRGGSLFSQALKEAQNADPG